MNRKTFLEGIACTAMASLAGAMNAGGSEYKTKQRSVAGGGTKHPRAITMWEFSWIERRWDGAGYEDWDRALDELVERGYDAVRIDPFPHLLATDANKTWTLLPEWNTQCWGAPDVARIVLLPALFEFLGKCRDRGIMVGLSTWYRQDEADTRMSITGPEVMASYWLKTLDLIAGAGLLGTVLYVDLCNEWPGDAWAPFMRPHLNFGEWDHPASTEFMHRAIAPVRTRYRDVPLFFSCGSDRVENYLEHDLSDFDLLDPHVWMAQENASEFYKIVGYDYQRFDPKGMTNMSLKAEPAYRARPQYWQDLLVRKIDRLARVSEHLSKPLITTECWGVVDYKDWPLLKWDWVKDLCTLGVQRASGSGQWLAIASSNFCGPQFVGMWRDKNWHLKMTEMIKSASINPGLRRGRLYERV